MENNNEEVLKEVVEINEENVTLKDKIKGGLKKMAKPIKIAAATVIVGGAAIGIGVLIKALSNKNEDIIELDKSDIAEDIIDNNSDLDK